MGSAHGDDDGGRLRRRGWSHVYGIGHTHTHTHTQLPAEQPTGDNNLESSLESMFDEAAKAHNEAHSHNKAVPPVRKETGAGAVCVCVCMCVCACVCARVTMTAPAVQFFFMSLTRHLHLC